MPEFTNLSADPQAAQDPRSRALAQTPTPTTDTRLTKTNEIDPATLPTLDQFLASRGMRTMPGQASVGENYQNFVAKPATDVLGNFISRGGRAAARGLGLPQPDPGMEERSKEVASMVVPQDLAQLGVMAGTLGAGGLAMNAGMTGMKAAGLRAGGAVLGGAAGGGLGTGTLQGAGMGAMQGALGGVAGEALGAGTNYLMGTRLGGAKQAINEIDAKNVAKVLPQIPRLQGVFGPFQQNPDGIWDLVKGYTEAPAAGGGTRVVNKWQAYLSQMAEQADQQIKQILGPSATQPKFPDPLKVEPDLPQLAKAANDPVKARNIREFRQQFGPDSPLPPELQDPAPGEPATTGPFVSSQTRLSYADFRANLTKLNEKIRYAQGSEKGDLLQQKAEALRGGQAMLHQLDPTDKALQTFDKSRKTYDAGMFAFGMLEDVLDKSGGVQSGATPFNSQALQSFLNKNRTEVAQHLEPAGEAMLRQAARIETPGRTDVMSPPGLHGTFIERMPGLPGYARGSLTRPDLMGNPLGLNQAARTGVTLGTEKVAGPMLDPITQRMLQDRSQGGGLPLK